MIQRLAKGTTIILLIYCTLLSIIVAGAGFFTGAKDFFGFQLLFLPVPAFFLSTLFRKLRSPGTK